MVLAMQALRAKDALPGKRALETEGRVMRVLKANTAAAACTWEAARTVPEGTIKMKEAKPLVFLVCKADLLMCWGCRIAPFVRVDGSSPPPRENFVIPWTKGIMLEQGGGSRSQ